jgi:hypothetical protein
MSDPDSRGGPVPGRGADTLEPPVPPVTGVTTYVEKRTVGVDLVATPGDVARSPVKVTVDGNKTLEGTQRVEALAYLGISEEVLDEAWYHFAGEVNIGQNAPLTGDHEWGTASQHQAGMGWQLEVEVVQDPKAGIEGLADIDLRTAKRSVTLWAMKWNTRTTYPPTPDGVKEKRVLLGDVGALGASWRTVDEGEMQSTENARDALLDARHELEWALEEIQVALKVADAAWKGPRSEVTKFKFGLEYEMIDAASKSTDEWRQYLEGLVKEQREAKEASDALKRELTVEAVFFLASFGVGTLIKLTFSAARGVKAAIAGEKVVSYAQKLERIVAPLRSRYVRVFDRIKRHKAAHHSTLILARGGGGLATTAAVNKAGGRPTTTKDWVIAFVLAGAGHLASKGADHFLLKKIRNKHKVNLSPPALGAAKGAADGGAQIPIKAGFTDDALEVPFALGGGAEAAKQPLASQLKRDYRALQNAPGSPAMKRAERRWNADRSLAHPEGRLSSPGLDSLRPYAQYIDEEIDAAVKSFANTIDPMLEFTFAVGTTAAEQVHKTTIPPPPPDLPDTPRGTVPQPVGVGLRGHLLR